MKRLIVHGTTTERAKSILKDGFKSNFSDTETNWSVSEPNEVYFHASDDVELDISDAIWNGIVCSVLDYFRFDLLPTSVTALIYELDENEVEFNYDYTDGKEFPIMESLAIPIYEVNNKLKFIEQIDIEINPILAVINPGIRTLSNDFTDIPESWVVDVLKTARIEGIEEITSYDPTILENKIKDFKKTYKEGIECQTGAILWS